MIDPRGFNEVEINLLRSILSELGITPDLSLPRGYNETVVYLTTLILQNMGGGGGGGIPDVPEGENKAYTRNRDAQGDAVWEEAGQSVTAHAVFEVLSDIGNVKPSMVDGLDLIQFDFEDSDAVVDDTFYSAGVIADNSFDGGGGGDDNPDTIDSGIW